MLLQPVSLKGFLFISMLFGSIVQAQNFKGIIVIAADGTFLGTCDNAYAYHSIINEYGKGSPYKSDSINNKYGMYGSEYSSLSAYNKTASNPPYLFSKDQKLLELVNSHAYRPSGNFIDSISRYSIGRLSVNKNIKNSIHPEIFKTDCR